MTVPISAVQSLHSIPPAISQRLDPDMPIHALLAAELALGQGDAVQQSTFPSKADFEASTPFLWSTELQSLLPSRVKELMKKQQDHFNGHWKLFSQGFPKTDKADYLYAWFLINTRTFYYETPETELYPWEDRLALLPVADLFNHSDTGCQVTFSPEYYTYTADRTYEAGEEVYISYGEHSNDYLLAEYGFVLDDNAWDRICLNDVVLPKLSEAQQKALEESDLLGEYTIQPSGEPDEKMGRALLILCSRNGDWRKDMDKVTTKNSKKRHEMEAKLLELAQEMLVVAANMLDEVNRSSSGQEAQRALLARRWQQIKTALTGIVQQEMG